MSKHEDDEPIWPVVVVIIVTGYAFYLGVWFGIAALVVGTVVLGWSKRHNGPL